MKISVFRRHPATRGAHHKALLDKIRFEYILNSAAFLAHSGRKRFNAYRTAIKFVDDRL